MSQQSELQVWSSDSHIGHIFKMCHRKMKWIIAIMYALVYPWTLLDYTSLDLTHRFTVRTSSETIITLKEKRQVTVHLKDEFNTCMTLFCTVITLYFEKMACRMRENAHNVTRILPIVVWGKKESKIQIPLVYVALYG